MYLPFVGFPLVINFKVSRIKNELNDILVFIKHINIIRLVEAFFRYILFF